MNQIEAATTNGTKTLPDGWRWVRLGDVLAEAQPGFACGERDTNGVIQLRMNNVTTRGEVVWDEFIRVPADNGVVERFRLVEGDIVFNNTNSTELVGKTALFVGHAEPVVYSNHFTRLRVAQGQTDPRYIAAWLNLQWQLKVFENLCNRWIGQSAVKNDKLLALMLPLPSLKEQQRIAAILGEQMAAVERARSATETQLEAAKTLPAAYLQDTFAGMESEQWPLNKLGGFIQSYRNGFGRRPKGLEVGPIVLRLADVSTGIIDLNQPRRVQMSDSEVREYALQRGDVLFVRVNGSRDIVGRCIVFEGASEAVVFNDHLIRVKLDDSLDPYFLRLVANLPFVRRQIVEYASTSAGQLTINQQALSSLEVPVPPIDVQQKVIERIRERALTSDRMTLELNEQLRMIERLPAALLRNAFNGEL